jgi:two-component system response regulator
MSGSFPIVLVEDNSDDVFFTLRALEEVIAENSVKVFRDGSEALDFLLAKGPHLAHSSAGLPHLVLLDMNLPRLNGIEVLKRLRMEERTRNVPVVVFTTSKQEADVSACYACGANSFVTKPIGSDEFARTVITVANYWLHINSPLVRED